MNATPLLVLCAGLSMVVWTGCKDNEVAEQPADKWSASDAGKPVANAPTVAPKAAGDDTLENFANPTKEECDLLRKDLGAYLESKKADIPKLAAMTTEQKSIVLRPVLDYGFRCYKFFDRIREVSWEPVILDVAIFGQRKRLVANSTVEIHEVAKALDLYMVKRGKYPTTAEGLKALVQGGELKKLPVDAWGNPIVYAAASGSAYTLTSLGADGKEGGTGVDADIVVE